MRTIPDLLDGFDPAPAIAAPDRPSLTRAGLREVVRRTASVLNAAGLGRGDRIAIVLANGPDAASAFIAVSAAATAAPLNPAYTADEIAFYLRDLGARAIILRQGEEGPARQAAETVGVSIFEMVSAETAGDFMLLTEATGEVARPGPAEAADIALVLHTSGTTARPKIVPLTHANVCASAGSVARSLALTEHDLCLNIMPLFHIHGLIAAVLASVSAGAAVCCTPGFNPFRVLGWMRTIRPTWITAVPTMYQVLLPYAQRQPESLSAGRLRLLRSSSASLPAPVMVALEAAFSVPVIESYGMTEAAHQMASNPLPPRARHPGSVGVAAGPEIAILGETGLLPPGEIGEVVIRGPNVMAGYENNPVANAAAFFETEWFRTGDEGVLDADGYLRLAGRLKEIINRGGEKISPLEVDAVLLEHPAVGQCVTFALPHTSLGEDVAVAVVLREGSVCDESALRDFAKARLAPFKVPRHYVFLDEIPKGPTGKVQRIGLAAKLGLKRGGRDRSRPK